MTTPTNGSRARAEFDAFGMRVSLCDRSEIEGFPPTRPPAPARRLTVHAQSDGIDPGWRGASPTRVREIADTHRRILMTVDYDEKRGYLLNAPGYARVLVNPTGTDVTYDSVRDDGAWHAFLVGQVMPLAATLQGLEPIHAAGVVADGAAFLLAGPQGVGKTTLATHLVLGGAELLSDDVVTVDGDLTADPGSALLNVRDHELRAMPAGRLPPGATWHAGREGRRRLAMDHRAGPVPISAVFVLERGTAGPAIEPVERPEPATLLGITFNVTVRTPERLIRQLELSAELASRVRMYRVRTTPAVPARILARELGKHLGLADPVHVA